MICPTCRGRQFVARGGDDEDELEHVPCPDCIGGVASCCDAAGSSAPRFVCPRCGAVSYNPNDIRERYCGRCHAFVDDPPLSPGVRKAMERFEEALANRRAVEKLAREAPRFICAGCGAVQERNTIRCEKCGRCHVFLDDGLEALNREEEERSHAAQRLYAQSLYRDDTFPERLCDCCGQLYRGPAVYCSLECAIEAA